MEFVEKYCGYKIWHFPRKGIYRVSEANKPNVFIHLNTIKDFKSVDEIKDIINQAPKSYVQYTDPYNVAIQWLREGKNKNNESYEEINLLVNQYQYGIEPKKELRGKLTSLGLLTR